MRRRDAHPRLLALALSLAVLVGALASATSPMAAQSRGESSEARERTAVEMCARAFKDRENARDARVERTIRSDYRKGQVSWEGYMTARRDGPDVSRRVACVVAFDGKNRITSFRVSDSGGGGTGGGNDAASRACWREAERRGYDVRDVADSLAAGSRGRLVVLRLDSRRELLCLHRGSATLYRPV